MIYEITTWTNKPRLVSGSNDTEYDEFHRHFTQLEQAAEKLIKDTKAFCEAVTSAQPSRTRHCWLSI